MICDCFWNYWFFFCVLWFVFFIFCCGGKKLSVNICYCDLCKRLMVFVFFYIFFFVFFVENDYSVIFYVLINFCRNNSFCYSWGVEIDFFIIVNEEYMIKFDFWFCIILKMVNIDFLVFLYFKLLFCYFYDCVYNSFILSV